MVILCPLMIDSDCHAMNALFSPLAIAPMIDWTNTHFRQFIRLIAPDALLYTEMQTPGAIIHNPKRALDFGSVELPLALQLGGATVSTLVSSAVQAEALGYSEINLNLGCPSDKVQAGQFGACLMAHPELVSECISALKQSVTIPVTAKTRIGIDHQDSYSFFANFVDMLVSAGADKLIVHARKAWLHGLNPKQNRTIPPVQYEYVYNIKQEYPSLPVVINGNIESLEAIKIHLHHVDGVMIGRLACNNPYALQAINHYLHPYSACLSRSEVLEHYMSYVDEQLDLRVPISLLLKPLFNFNHGRPGARLWKEQLLQAQQSKSTAPIYQALNLFETA